MKPASFSSVSNHAERPDPPARRRPGKVWVVVPTYNERDNLSALLPELLRIHPEVHVVVVDDGSPDGTGDLVRQVEKRTDRVHLLQRGARRGYASAVQEGLRVALEAGAALLVQMDADFSHDPAAVPALVELTSSRCQVAIGSRYVAGGGTRNWSLFRRGLSFGANALARFLLSLPTRDCTGGFRCYRRAVVEESGLLDLRIEGYSFLLASLYLVYLGGWRAGEIPILFVDRQWGRSKLSGRVVVEAALVTLRLTMIRLGVLPRTALFAPGFAAPRETRR